jgi:formylmethanofuran--tetrahydromethanopterin N-formyltransferase
MEKKLCFDVFRGLGASILITGYKKEYLEHVAIEFCAQSSLPYGKSEAGIHNFLPPEETPDHRWGVVCSIWVQKNSEDEGLSSKLLIKFLNERISITLFPKLGIQVFSWTPNPVDFYNSEKELGDFGDGYNNIEEKFDRKFLSIPMTGGDFWIEQKIGIQPGFLGASLFLFFENVKSAAEIESKISDFLFKYPKTVQIYGLIASGSKIGAKNIYKKDLIISTNENYCPSLKKQVGKESKVPDDVNCITELVLNSFSIEHLKTTLKFLLKFLRTKKSIINFTPISYDDVKDLFDLKSFTLDSFV